MAPIVNEEYELVNISPARATPNTIPRFLAVATVPDAMPRLDIGTQLMIAVLFGETKRAVPIPARAIRQTIDMIPIEGCRLKSENKDMIRNPIPHMHNGRDPSLSYKLPDIGLMINKNKKGTIMTNPVVDAENPHGYVR